MEAQYLISPQAVVTQGVQSSQPGHDENEKQEDDSETGVHHPCTVVR